MPRGQSYANCKALKAPRRHCLLNLPPRAASSEPTVWARHGHLERTAIRLKPTRHNDESWCRQDLEVQDVIDCIVSEWGQWSECDTACGNGMMSRTRIIEQKPQNGGKHCPSLVQKRGCQGLKCHNHHDRKALRGTVDQVANLERRKRENKSRSTKRERDDSSCGGLPPPTIRASLRCIGLNLPKMDIISATGPQPDPQQPDLMDQSCSCSVFAQQTQHALSETALLLPAALSKSRHENDTSDIRRNLRLRYKNAFKHNRGNEYCVEFEVIKATKACHKDATYRGLAEGERVIVRCDLEALHEDKSVDTLASNSIHDEDDPETPKYRCRGDGLTGRNTRFTTLALPACRGKWMRLTVGQPKKCPTSDAQFIFI
ncbi:hypothetical protein AND_005240 [Anopheles darlingi]|uniref:Spondin-like TSP1 domain-containing protein n=1 Tax=Anopheles darlingi TaxID=43151 RepID=W5JIE4_ANODA|nr:hypothetical protein AND_005240 [Anopheles darlingi]